MSPQRTANSGFAAASAACSTPLDESACFTFAASLFLPPGRGAQALRQASLTVDDRAQIRPRSGQPSEGTERRETSQGQDSAAGLSAGEPHPLAVLLLGPTGSGKTALSLELAGHFGGEIVSCDSVAVYRGMELGSAKPTPQERERAPHHLIDVTMPDHPFTAGDYSRAARAALHDIAARNRLPIVTGGTGSQKRAGM